MVAIGIGHAGSEGYGLFAQLKYFSESHYLRPAIDACKLFVCVKFIEVATLHGGIDVAIAS